MPAPVAVQPTSEAAPAFSKEGHNLAAILAEQGRTLEWLRRRPNLVDGLDVVSRTYMHRLRLAANHPFHSPPPPNFWANIARELGVPLQRLTGGTRDHHRRNTRQRNTVTGTD